MAEHDWIVIEDDLPEEDIAQTIVRLRKRHPKLPKPKPPRRRGPRAKDSPGVLLQKRINNKINRQRWIEEGLCSKCGRTKAEGEDRCCALCKFKRREANRRKKNGIPPT